MGCYREVLSDVHGDQFADLFDETFEIEPKPTLRSQIASIVKSRVVFYVAGLIDGALLILIILRLLM